MTIAAEPEIVLDGLGAEPAPNFSASHDPPPAPSAPSQSDIPIAESASPAMATATATPIGTTQATIVRTALPDGSLEVQVTSTTTDISDGYRHIQTAFYRIPASLAETTAASLDAGDVASALYLTRVEEQMVPPDGQGAVHPPSGGDSQPQPQYQQSQQPIDDYFQNHNNRPSWQEARNRNWLRCVLFIIFFGVILLPMIAVFASRRHVDDGATSTWNDDIDDDWRSSFFDDDYYHNWRDGPKPPTVPTISPRPSSSSSKDTGPPWLRPYTLPPHLFAPTPSPSAVASEPTASPRPTADFGDFLLPPFFGAWTPPPFYDGSVIDDEESDADREQ